MTVELISDDSRYNLLRISKGTKYIFYAVSNNRIAISNDVCITKYVPIKDFKICKEN